MKTLLIAISLMTTIVSVQSHASDASSANVAAVSLSPLFPFAATSAVSSMLSTETNVHKEAQIILNEGQQYFQTGEMGILIGSKVEQLQEEQDMSDDEAVDMLMNQASEILK